MPPLPSDPMAPARGPRHAAGAAPDERNTAYGRHRRPESLADTTPPRSAPPGRTSFVDVAAPADRPRDAWAVESTTEWLLTAPRSARSGSHRAEESHPADAAIAAAREAAARRQAAADPADTAAPADRGAAPADRTRSSRHAGRRARSRRAQSGQAESSQAQSGQVESGRARSQAQSSQARSGRGHSRRAAPRRGRHAQPSDPLAITVRPVPVVRDALSEGLRAAGAVREWALWTGDRPPTGAHRAPGTLPIESWLLVGRTRQQALLATLVAVGLALVMIPGQRNDDVNPVNAADTAAVATEARQKPPAKAAEGAAEPARRTTPAAPDRTAEARKPATEGSAPPASATSPATPGAAAPPVALPPGDGPARSLRTTGSQVVALTFDDGPDPVHTPQILAMLAERGITATFCLVGSQVERHPEVVRRIAAAGHTLCNHSWDHSFTLGKQKPSVIRADLSRTNEAIRAAVPDAEIPFFRAPGGNFTDRLVQVAYADRMASLYWEVDPRDWEHAPGADAATHVKKIVTDVRASVRPGSIVLSHDFNQPDTITAYEQLLPWLSENFELGVPSVPAPTLPGQAPSPPQPPAGR